MNALSSFAEPWLLLLADDPLLRLLQAVLLLAGAIVIFLVFFTTRDILSRTHSFPMTLFSIVLVAALPVIGFLIYLLVRPGQTLKDKELFAMVQSLTGNRGVPKPVTNIKPVKEVPPSPKKEK